MNALMLITAQKQTARQGYRCDEGARPDALVLVPAALGAGVCLRRVLGVARQGTQERHVG